MSTRTTASHSVRLLTVSAMFAALITVSTAYLFHIPISGGGYIHLGDAFLYLAASLLPTPYACLAGAIGAGAADLLSGAAMWMPATVIIKSLAAACFTNAHPKLLCRRNLLALLAGAVLCMGGYYLAEVILTGSWAGPLVSVSANGIQGLGSAVLYVIMAAALDRSHLKNRLFDAR